jgi:hypothetical protein
VCTLGTLAPLLEHQSAGLWAYSRCTGDRGRSYAAWRADGVPTISVLVDRMVLLPQVLLYSGTARPVPSVQSGLVGHQWGFGGAGRHL